MEKERGRPVPQKHAKTSDPFNEKLSKHFPCLIEEDLARGPLPVKTIKIWPLKNY